MREVIWCLLTAQLLWGAAPSGAGGPEDAKDEADAVVAADGSAQFRTLQDAINAAPQATSARRRWTILIRPGTYRELVYVQREKRFVSLVGEDPATTIITYDLHAGVRGPDGKPIGTFRTPTVTIDADDFSAENLTFQNTAGPIGQALAVRVDGDRVVFRNCRFLGWQDTMLLDRGRHYIEDSYIAGHVDFIFGGATAVFERAHIHCLRSGYITAASTPQEQPYGFVFRHARITGESPEVRSYLGRPWRDYAHVAFVDTDMTAVVASAGWHNWDKPEREGTSRFAEYGSTGEGGASAARVRWARVLSASEAAALTPRAVLEGADKWDPQTVPAHPVSARTARAAAQGQQTPPADWRATGRSDPAFPAPSLAPGVDYTVPTEAEIVRSLARIRDFFVRSTPYRIIDTATGRPIAELTAPSKTAGIDLGDGEFNDWTYSMGVVLAGMLQASDVTGDPEYARYALKNFDFIFDHLDYFKRQAERFGPQPYGYRRLLDMKELDDCGAIGAALIKAYAKKPDPRYRAAIDLVARFISGTMTRLPDGTLARQRPQWPTVWSDDAYMSIPFLAQMGRLSGDRKYFDDGVRQVIGFADHLMDSNGLYDHARFISAGAIDPKFHWGRGGAWAVMASAELLSVLPENHPGRERVLEIFRRAVQGVAPLQSGTGMWHQLVDRQDSYPETSVTAMLTFAIARGVNRGWLPPIYAPVAQAGWRALEQRIRDDGQIEGICFATTAAYDAVYYYNRPTSLKAMQGYGPALMAGAEMIELLRRTDIRHTLNTFHYSIKEKRQ